MLPGVATPCPAAPPMDTAKLRSIQVPSHTSHDVTVVMMPRPVSEAGIAAGLYQAGDPRQNEAGSRRVPSKDEKTALVYSQFGPEAMARWVISYTVAVEPTSFPTAPAHT